MRRPSGVYVLTEKIKVDKHRVHVAKVKDGAEPSEIGYIVKLDKTTGTRKCFYSQQRLIALSSPLSEAGHYWQQVQLARADRLAVREPVALPA